MSLIRFDKKGLDGVEYSLVYMLSTEDNLPSELNKVFRIYGEPKFELIDFVDLKEKEIEKLFHLEERVIKKKLYRRFGVKSLKAENHIFKS